MKRILFLFSTLITFGAFTQTNNELQGSGAGINITTGDNNTIYGDSAGVTLTTGSGVTLIGNGAGYNITSGGSGWNVYENNHAGSNHDPASTGIIAIGQGAGYMSTTGIDNVLLVMLLVTA